MTLLGIFAVILGLLVLRFGPREAGRRIALTVSGYFRRRLDPAAERTLRAVFTELDVGLAEILADRPAPGAPGTAGGRGPGCDHGGPA
jgi:hypothetical protein